MGLLCIPGTSSRGAQPVHDFHKTVHSMPCTLHQRTLGYYQNRCRIEFWSVFWEIQSAKWEILRYVATAGIERAEENLMLVRI